MRFSLRLPVFLFAILFFQMQLFSQCIPAPVINFVNPSFEGTPQPHISPSPWTECQSGQTPDTQPGSWGVTLPATNGSTYLGLVAQPSTGWQEGVSEQLSSPFISGTTYTFNIDLANALQSTSGSGIIPGCAECQIWGGFTSCDDNTGTGVLLWASGNITPYDVWQTHTVTFTPTQNFTWVLIRIHSLGCTDGPYILVDNISPIRPANVTASVQVNNNVSCAAGTNGAATVHAVGLNPPFTYAWNTGLITSDSLLTNVPAGSYSVTVTDANTCADTVAITITQPTPIVLTPTIVPATCFGLSTGSAYMSYAGGTAPLSFSWSNGPTTQPNPNLFAGTYGITATDANACTAATSISITQPTAIVISALPIDATCANNNGTVTTTVVGGDNSYTYLWNNAAITPNIENLSPGNYSLTTTDGVGCTATASVTINAGAGLSLSPTSNDATCGNNNGSANVDVGTGAGPYSYLWNTNDTTQAVSGLSPGSYSVTVTGAGGCSATSSITISSSATLNLTPSGRDATCSNSNGSATVDVAVGSGPYTYLWSNTETTPTILNLVSGVYTVTVTGSGGCSATSSITVNSASGLGIAPTTVDPTCGNNNGSASVAVTAGTGPYSYEWSNSDTTQSILNLTSGNYLVTVTGLGGCSATASVTVNPSIGLTLSPSSNNATCGNTNGNATIDVTAGAGPYTYLWNTTDVSQTILNLAAGNYSVTVTGAGGCTASSNITISYVNAVTLTSSSTTANCAVPDGSATVTTTNGTSPFTYLWNTGGTDSTILNIASGAYTVTVTSQDGCTAVTSVTVSSSNPVVASASPVNTTCGSNNGSITITVATGTAPFTYLWSNGGTNSSVSNLAAGNYSVTINDVNGCNTTVTATVNSSTISPAVITSNKNVMCSGDSAQVCVTGTYTSYLWNTGQTSPCIYTQLAGNYYVTVTDAGNCTTTSNRLAIGVYPLPPVSISLNEDTLVGYDAVSYQWYLNNIPIPGATSEIYVVPQPGNYNLEVTDTNGCKSYSTKVTVTIAGIDDLISLSNVNVYPNPLAFGNWNIEVGENLIGSQIEIFDDNGRLVYKSEIGDMKSEIDLNVARGIYIMRLTSTVSSYAFKLIKL